MSDWENPWENPDVDMLSVGSLISAFIETAGANLKSSERTGRPLRKENISPAEVTLAAALRQEGYGGYVQQHPFGSFAVDFFWPDTGLVVEVDGKEFHRDQERERSRDTYLREHGANAVIHLESVFRDLDGCVENIGKYLFAKREVIRLTAELAAKEKS